jgi:ankyrin repeat protein
MERVARGKTLFVFVIATLALGACPSQPRTVPVPPPVPASLAPKPVLHDAAQAPAAEAAAVPSRSEVAAVSSDTASSEAAPIASPTLGDLLGRLEQPWQLEETGKAYWIGYTKDMRAIAERGEEAIPCVVAFVCSAHSARAKYGALLALHYMGIGGQVVGRFEEAFTDKPARDALLGLLSTEPSLQVDVLTLLIRDPWPTDLPVLLGLLGSGTPNDWAFAKALQRYDIADAPVHQHLPPALAAVGKTPPQPVGNGVYVSGMRTSVSSKDGGFKSGRLEALKKMPEVVLDGDLVPSELWDEDDAGSCDESLETALRVLTECDYCWLGDRLEYYVAEGKVHLCGMKSARSRWLAWYRAHDGSPLGRQASGQHLWAACWHGGLERVTALLDASPEFVNARPYRDSTPLQVAAEQGREEIVPLLLARGADRSLRDKNGRTPLHLAAAYGHDRIVQSLLTPDAVDAPDAHGMTPLALAASAGHLDVVATLLRHGAQDTVFAAAARGTEERVAVLLAKDPKLANARDGEGLTPLHYAARLGHAAVIDQLLAAHADPEGGAPRGKNTPLHEASYRGHVEAIRALLRGGASLHAIGGLWGVQTPLQEAAWGKQLEAARVLLDAGAPPNDNFERKGRPALEWACFDGNVAFVTLLLDRGADVNARDMTGETGLHVASFKDEVELAKLLLDRGAQVDARDDHGATPLESASTLGYVRAIALLLDRGADVNHVDKDGRTALQNAVECYHDEAARLLRARGAREK